MTPPKKEICFNPLDPHGKPYYVYRDGMFWAKFEYKDEAEACLSESQQMPYREEYDGEKLIIDLEDSN